MKITIEITESELASKKTVDILPSQEKELAIILSTLNPDPKGQACDMIGGLISIGIDVTFDRIMKKNLKAHFDIIDKLWDGGQ